MALRPIVNVPDTVLRRKAHKVTEFDQDLQTLIDDMVDTLRAAPGVGLAAPQVGISERLRRAQFPRCAGCEAAAQRPGELSLRHCLQ